MQKMVIKSFQVSEMDVLFTIDLNFIVHQVTVNNNKSCIKFMMLI